MSRLLVKFPTRERPKQFMATLDKMYAMMGDPALVDYLFAFDNDDFIPTAETPPHIALGPRVSKVEAVNRGVNEWAEPWDILLVMSDDMICQQQGWDNIIRSDMAANFPDLDGCLWYPDGHQENLCTMPIMGRKYYDRFGYIYHPSYESLWCDNEQHEVADGMGKMFKGGVQLFEHKHPGWGTAKMDPLYQRNNNSRMDKADRENYDRRKAQGFP